MIEKTIAKNLKKALREYKVTNLNKGICPCCGQTDKNAFTQKWLAEQVGVTYITINKYFIGERAPSIKTLLNIAEVLDTSIYQLLEETEQHSSVAVANKIGRFHAWRHYLRILRTMEDEQIIKSKVIKIKLGIGTRDFTEKSRLDSRLCTMKDMGLVERVSSGYYRITPYGITMRDEWTKGADNE